MHTQSQTFEDVVPCTLCEVGDLEPVFAKTLTQPAQILCCDLMYSSPLVRLAYHEIHEPSQVEGLLKGVETEKVHRYRWRFEKESGQVRDVRKTRI